MYIKGRRHRAAVLIALLVTVGILFIPAVPAADDRGQMMDENYPSLDYSLHNGALPNASMQEMYGANPTPVTIYHFELEDTSLPGPREMAYGPSLIALAMDPMLIAVLVAGCVIIAGAWYLLSRRKEDEEHEEEEDPSGKDSL
ncbi:MAG: hypothetical protein ACYDDV_09025 [Methanoregula sp.]